MRKVELIIEAADLATFYAEPGIEKVVVFQQDNKVVAEATIEEDLVDKEKIKEKLIVELSDKLTSVSETEELEYLLAA